MEIILKTLKTEIHISITNVSQSVSEQWETAQKCKIISQSYDKKRQLLKAFNKREK